MKRQITANKETTIRAPEPLKSTEREFAKTLKAMIDQMQTRFINQAIESLNKRTVEKFADAQIGNYAAIFLNIARKVRKKLLNQFSDDRIDRMVEDMTSTVSKRNKEKIYSEIEKKIGISERELISTEGLTSQVNALILETKQWVKKLRDDTLEYFTNLTLRGMAEGRTLPEIKKLLSSETKDRKSNAEMVARTQASTFNSLNTKLRAQNLGITEAIWVTSRDERVRESHAARDGKKFDLSEGLYSSTDGKTLLPGVFYNCFPGHLKLNNTPFCNKLFRRWYTGKLTEIISDDGVILQATPNHPILTDKGFKPAKLINKGDNIIKTINNRFDGIEFNGKNMIPTFEEIFNSFVKLGITGISSPHKMGKFHGDFSDSDINVISIDSLLRDEINPSIREKFSKLKLSMSDKEIILNFLTCNSSSFTLANCDIPSLSDFMSIFNLIDSSFLRHLTPLELFGFALGSWCDTTFDKSMSYNISANVKVFSDCIFAFSVLVHGYNFFNWYVNNILFETKARGFKASLREFRREGAAMDTKLFSDVNDCHSILYKTNCVIDNRVVDFSGHIYNLETISGYYITKETVVSNCRCTYRLIIPGDDE